MTAGMNMSTVLGQCPRKSDCDYMFKIYMALSVVGSFISACGGTPGYIVLLRSEVYGDDGSRRANLFLLQAVTHPSVRLNADIVFQVHS